MPDAARMEDLTREYDRVMAQLRAELLPFVHTLRERVDLLGELPAVAELAGDLRQRPVEEVGGIAVHAVLLLARREVIE